MAAADYFLKFDGIDGESTDFKHKLEIDLVSWSWGETHTGSAAATGAGLAGGRVSIQDFHFVSGLTKASPKLLLACASGQRIPSALLTGRRNTSPGSNREGQFEFLFVKFTNVLVSSVQEVADTNAERPVESVSFNFSKIDLTYKEQKVDGTLGSTVQFAWDLTANRKG